MAKIGRPIPAGEERGPRDHKVTIYLTKEEADEIERVRKLHDFRSSSAFLAFLVEPLAKDNFTGVSFLRMGKKFADMVGKLDSGEFAWAQMNPFHKLQMPSIEDVNNEQEAAEKSQNTNEQ